MHAPREVKLLALQVLSEGWDSEALLPLIDWMQESPPELVNRYLPSTAPSRDVGEILRSTCYPPDDLERIALQYLTTLAFAFEEGES